MLRLTKMNKLRKPRNTRGQGITEYGAMIAFVSILVALVFSLTNGKLTVALSCAFSSVASQLNNLSAQSGGSSS